MIINTCKPVSFVQLDFFILLWKHLSRTGPIQKTVDLLQIFYILYFYVAKTKDQQTRILFNHCSFVCTSSQTKNRKPYCNCQTFHLSPAQVFFWVFLFINEMVELRRPTKNRGFYVRMRLLHSKNGRPQEKGFFYRYYKWVLWFSLSLYLFSSYFITKDNPHNKATSLAKTRVSNSASRALFESTNASLLQQPTSNPGEPFFLTFLLKIFNQLRFLIIIFYIYIYIFFPTALLNNLKIFVYDLPPNYNTDWLSNERCSNHLFAAEVAIHRALLNSHVRTFDPYEADFFFVPVYVSCNFSTVNGFPAIGHARSLLASAVRLISSDYPLWNRTRGSDHVFVASHDYGACFHAMVKHCLLYICLLGFCKCFLCS